MTAKDPPAERIDASRPDATPISEGAQNKGASASATSSMKPTKKGPMIVKAMPTFLVSGVRDARAVMKPTMAKDENIIHSLMLPPHLTIKPAATEPKAVAEATVHLRERDWN